MSPVPNPYLGYVIYPYPLTTTLIGPSLSSHFYRVLKEFLRPVQSVPLPFLLIFSAA